MNHRLMVIGVGVAACLSAAVAPASAQSVYGQGYAYGPTHGSLYWYAPQGYAYGHRPRRGYAGPSHGNVPGRCAVDLGNGRWQSCDSLGPR